jgi:hypothetical protein
MIVEAQITARIDVLAVKVSAEVRYWDDADVNGQQDTEDGANIPLRVGPLWCPIIELDTGRVRNWPAGTTASIHYKVADAGTYELLGPVGNVVAKKDGYVPDFLSVGEDGFGDYIILEIGADGLITGWKAPTIEADSWTWEKL